MTNHAARGRRSENNVRDELGAYGYDVMRSAASKGAADLIAVGDGFAVLVQVKLVKHGESFQMPSPLERQQLLRIASRLGNGHAVAACHMQGSGSRPAITVYRRLTGPGPKDWSSWAPGCLEEEAAATCCYTGAYGTHTLACPTNEPAPFMDLMNPVKL